MKTITKIFISYRREDNPDAAGRIYDRLSSHFGHQSVFFDIDSVPLGVDFRQHIDEVVSQCDVLLAVIGDNWIAIDDNGRPRLESSDDFVRIEVETAMKRSIPVIPVLVGNAKVPLVEELPSTIKELVYRNAAEVRSGTAFKGHMDRLIEGIESSGEAIQADTRVRRRNDLTKKLPSSKAYMGAKWISLIFACIAAAGIIYFYYPWNPNGKGGGKTEIKQSERKINRVIDRSNASQVTEISRIQVNGFCVGWFRNSETYAVLPFGDAISLVNLKQPKNLKTLDLGIKSSKFAINPVDDFIAINDIEHKEVRIVNLKNNSTEKVFKSQANQPGMAFRNDGLVLAVAGYGSPVKVWNSATGKLIRQIIPKTRDGGLTLVFHPKSNILAVGNRNDVTEIWNVNTGSLVKTLGKKMSHEVEFSHDGSKLAVAYVDGKVGIWELDIKSRPIFLDGEAEENFSISWSPNGEILATAGLNGQISLWDTATMKMLHAFFAPERVYELEFSPDGTMLLSGGEGSTQVWGLKESIGETLGTPLTN